MIAVLVVVAVAGAVRLQTEATPVLHAQRVLPSIVRFPGGDLRPVWPTEGEAAAAVPGIGTVGASGGEAPLPIASVAKVMTAYLTLRAYPIAAGQRGFRVKISAGDVADYQQRVSESQSTVPVAKGEVLDEAQLLEALLIPSANNIAALLANYVAGSQAAFVARMNATAQSLGMTHTTYTDPSGFTASTVSTAADQVRLAEVAMQEPELAHIVRMRAVTLPVAGTVSNYDELAGEDGFVGIKTGSDSEAGGCFVFANRRVIDGHPVTVYGAVLGQDAGVSSTDVIVGAALDAAEALADSVADAIHVRAVLPKGTAIAYVTNAAGSRVVVRTSAPLTQLGWDGLHYPVSVTLLPLGTTLTAGQRVGTVTLGGTHPVSVPAVAGSTMPSLSLSYRLSHLL
jgi:D-alanyl-D-alanine carboxypeptidase (penicillin-binding protein 5/6)